MSSPKLSLKLTSRAERDLESILSQSRISWGEQQMDAYHAAIDRALDDLCDFPAMGRARDDLGPGIRSRRVEQRIIFYRVETDAIRILRILHGRREVRRELLE